MPEADIFDGIKIQNYRTQNEINRSIILPAPANRLKAVKKAWTGQHARLMRLFRANPGQWISLTEILATGVAQYNARILELRSGGENIENKTAWVGRQRHSWFCWTEK